VKGDALPRGRGDGQPVRLMVDLTNEDDVVDLFVWAEGRKYLVAASDGRGFVVKSEDMLAEKRTGKQVLVVDGGVEAAACKPVEGDTVAVLGENRKLLVFPLEQLPVMNRGVGTMLQKYKDGGLKAVRVFAGGTGLVWQEGARARSMNDLQPYVGNRADSGRLAPNWVPKL
jgi:topoisomerase IV subunit A